MLEIDVEKACSDAGFFVLGVGDLIRCRIVAEFAERSCAGGMVAGLVGATDDLAQLEADWFGASAPRYIRTCSFAVNASKSLC